MLHNEHRQRLEQIGEEGGLAQRRREAELKYWETVRRTMQLRRQDEQKHYETQLRIRKLLQDKIDNLNKFLDKVRREKRNFDIRRNSNYNINDFLNDKKDKIKKELKLPKKIDEKVKTEKEEKLDELNTQLYGNIANIESNEIEMKEWGMAVAAQIKRMQDEIKAFTERFGEGVEQERRIPPRPSTPPEPATESESSCKTKSIT